MENILNEYYNEESSEKENELENGFEPYDEKINVKEDYIDNFVPKDELESINETFEVNFKPMDESRNGKVNIEEKFPPKNEKSTQKFREMIRNIDWNVITTDWKIKLQKNQFPSQQIQLNPKQDCSRANPLYKHKIWLKTVYTKKNLNLTDQMISKVCGVHLTTIQNWRKKHNIPAKVWTNGKWVDDRGYVKILMPKGYLHPELVPNKGRNVRMEHVIVMEKYLSKHPELEWSKKYLIDGKYLKLGTIVHHINFNKSDNRLENLWLSENIESHKKVENTLNECFRDLIKLNQIGFKNENYYINNNFDCRDLSPAKIKEILKPISISPYKDINLIKEEIKKINWNEISDNWTVEIYKNQYSEKEIIKLDPYSDCTDKNPLYLHREWVNRLVHDKEFNLTTRRLADLCGVDRGVIHYWSKVKHKINMENEKRGFGRYQHSAGGIWMRVPENYENPIAKNNKGWMYEHRYIIERYLAENPELDLSKKYLIDGKYLKSDYIVHHINFDPLDNRMENLWICENQIEHRNLETSLTPLIDDLIRSNHISFRNGKYILNLKKTAI